MATIFSISKGEYSDYSVLALFVSQEDAQAAIDLMDKDGYGDPFIETFELYDEVPERVTNYRRQLVIWDNGTTGPKRKVSILGSDAPGDLQSVTDYPWELYGRISKRPYVRYVRAPIFKGEGGRLEVNGTDAEAVNRAFSDHRARILAEGHLAKEMNK